MKEMETSRV